MRGSSGLQAIEKLENKKNVPINILRTNLKRELQLHTRKRKPVRSSLLKPFLARVWATEFTSLSACRQEMNLNVKAKDRILAICTPISDLSRVPFWAFIILVLDSPFTSIYWKPISLANGNARTQAIASAEKVSATWYFFAPRNPWPVRVHP